MKKIVFILQMLCPYLYLGVRFYAGISYGTVDSTFLSRLSDISLYVMIGVSVITLIYALIMAKHLLTRELLFWGLLIKVVLIPFYVMIFLIGVAAVFPILTIIAIPLLAALDYAVMLPSSVVCVKGFKKAHSEHSMNIVAVVLLSICQFIFCLDIIAAFLGFTYVKKAQKAKPSQEQLDRQ